ncbi:MAG: hypothetical protein HOA61_18775, partial [Bacteroidetes bacterium]|nr:hypothetical protein [Bacteroidota bacterium]
MKKQLTLSILCFFSFTYIALSQSLSGSYEIGITNADYTTITNAAAALDTHGISGPVVFNIQDGSYNEQLTINKIVGSSPTNTITFQSKSGDSSKVTIHHNGTYDNYIFHLNGAKNIILRNLTLKADHPDYSQLILLDGKIDSFVIENNMLLGGYNPSFNYGDNGRIIKYLFSTSTVDTLNHITIKNNHFRRGSSSIFIFCHEDYYCRNLTIERNTFDSFSKEAVNLMRIVNLKILNNYVRGVDQSLPSFKGIVCGSVEGTLSIEKNRIYLNHHTFNFGLGISFNGTPTNRGLVANNIVDVVVGSGSINENSAFATSGSTYLDIVHNTFRVKNISYGPNTNSTGMSAGLGSGYNNRFLNNIVVNNNALAIQLYDSLYYSDCDYNCFYTACDTIARHPSAGYIKKFSDWQVISGYDQHSVFFNPIFDSIVDIKHHAYHLNFGTTFPLVTTDFYDSARISPTMGAYELDKLQYDLAMQSFLSPLNSFCPSSQPIKIAVKNVGADTIKSDSIIWFANSARQNSVYFNKHISPGDTAHISMGMYDFTRSTDDSFSFIHSLINDSITDLNPYNDSLSFNNIQNILAGTYHIGGSQADFSTLTEGLATLVEKGMCDTITFLIHAGTYYEDAFIPFISGHSKTQPIYIKGVDKDSVFLVAKSYRLLRIMSADYINIENITFKGNSNGGSTLIYLSYGTNHLSIQNNVFILDSNSYGCQAIYLTQNTIKSEYINISNNTFIGGDDHIYISAIHTAKDAQEFVIQNNYFRKANNHGIRINRTDSCLIQNNTFVGDSALKMIAVYLYGCNRSVITNNKIKNVSLGFQITDENRFGNDTSNIINNLVHVNGGNGNTLSVGILFYDSEKINIYHNSISSNKTTLSNTYLLYFYSGVEDIKFVNNIFYGDGDPFLIR